MNQKVIDQLAEKVQQSSLSENEKQAFHLNFMKLQKAKLNIMITGATGSGKSSTINAMFKTNRAKVGTRVDPETMSITKYELGNMILWDSPGLGDGKEKDNQHSKAIIKKLNELDENGQPLIDLVLVILDGGSRDLGTSYELINSIIIPNLEEDTSKRLLIAINQADMGMKGRYWDYDDNKPTPKLEKFLDEKVLSVQTRVKETTGILIDPIYYSAGFKEEDEEQVPYNLSKLLYLIVNSAPKNKRLSIADHISKDSKMWKSNDTLKDYNKEIKKSFLESVTDGMSTGVEWGEKILGDNLLGKAVGGAVGAVAGAIGSVFSGIFG